jgi:phytoene synthase
VSPSSILRRQPEEGFPGADGVPGRARARWLDRAIGQLSPRDRRAQRASLAMAAIYRTLLDEIARDGYRVLERRVALTPIRKLWLAWRAARAA